MAKPMFTASTNTHPLGYKKKSRTRYLTGTLEKKKRNSVSTRDRFVTAPSFRPLIPVYFFPGSKPTCDFLTPLHYTAEKKCDIKNVSCFAHFGKSLISPFGANNGT